MRYQFSKEIYLKEALIKTAYGFTDKAYLHIDTDDKYYYVTIDPKNNDISISEKEFHNNLLAEMVRINVSQRTRNVRELILARAFSSTVIEENAVEPPPEIELDINDVLTDWFEKYDNDKA